MTDQVLYEIRYIETDDGYRVEIKGDKEKLKEMGFMHKGFGPGKRFGRDLKFRGRGHGHGYGPPPWTREREEPTEEEAAPPKEADA